MSDVVLTALISSLSVAIPSIIATVVSNKNNHKLLVYRIDELEEKVDKHNNVIERTYVLERDLKTAFNYIDDLKKRKE